jgi:hypothetical protein
MAKRLQTRPITTRNPFAGYANCWLALNAGCDGTQAIAWIDLAVRWDGADTADCYADEAVVSARRAFRMAVAIQINRENGEGGRMTYHV